jgi:hypothetical protein
MQLLLHILSGGFLPFNLVLIIKYQVNTKKHCWRKRRTPRQKKGSASEYQVHTVALNIDDKVGNSSSVCFDAYGYLRQ